MTGQTQIDPAPTRQQFVSVVKQNLKLCREHYRLVLGLKGFPPTQPGQFIQIACRDLSDDESECPDLDWQPGGRVSLSGAELQSPLAFLRRPFSLAGRVDSGNEVELEIIHRVVGLGTDWLSRLHTGDSLHILGPLGNRFELPPPGQTAILVGGGVGIPPMLYLAAALSGRDAIAFCGATTRDLMPLTIDSNAQAEEFTRHGIRSVLCTDDGTLGFRGFVTQALEKHLDSVSARHVLYTCGPEPMMKRVAEIAIARNIPCQIAVERAMACGMGTCQSCVIRVKAPSDPKGWVYKLACTDGPIFRAADLLW